MTNIQITVTNTNDSGAGSFRQALYDAVALDEAVGIRFAEGLSGQTITLLSTIELEDAQTTNQVFVYGDTNADGAFDITISGDANGDNIANDGDVRLLTISDGVNLTLNHLHLTNGFDRGADATVSEAPEAPQTAASVILVGGSIGNSGELTINNTLISNSVAYGGNRLGSGLVFDGGGAGTVVTDANAYLTISRSLFSGNSAAGGDGGPFAAGGDAASGILSDSASTIVIDTGFSGTATGGNGGEKTSNAPNDNSGGDASISVTNIRGLQTGATFGIAATTGAAIGGQGGGGAYPGADGTGAQGPVDADIFDSGVHQIIATGDVGADDLIITNTAFPRAFGFGGDDTIRGSGLEDQIYGGAGADVLSGAGGLDFISGGADDDRIRIIGFEEVDNIDGGSGADTLDLTSANGGGFVVDLASDEAVRRGAEPSGFIRSIESVTGTAENDELSGDEGANQLDGGAGDDTLTGQGGADTLIGGFGADMVTGGDQGDVIRGDADAPAPALAFEYFNLDSAARSVDAILGGEFLGQGLSTRFGGIFDSELTRIAEEFTPGDTDFFGVRFTGVISVVGGDYTFRLEQDDGARVSIDGQVVVEEDGLNPLGTPVFGEVALAPGLHDIEILFFEFGGSEVLSLDVFGPGLSTFEGIFSPDILQTLPSQAFGDDTLTGGGGGDRIDGDGGDDLIDGGQGDDTLSGGDGADVLIGGGGDDVENGGGGADRFEHSIGANTIDGGADQDSIEFGGALADFAITVTNGVVVANGAGGVSTISNVETFTFTDQTLSLSALDAIANPPQPETPPAPPPTPTPTPTPPLPPQPPAVPGPTVGADNLTGTSDADEIDALGGNDTVTGLNGDDTLTGSSGKDVLIGNGGADLLSGGGGKDRMEGGGGKDTLNGGGGKDTLNGGGGKDTLDGGGGKDLMTGGGGKDLILGGRGNDALTGGGGRDTFQFKTGDRRDTITDFQQGKDRIEITEGAEAFADLTINQRGDDARIEFSSVRITVQDADADDFSAADFLFS